MKNRQTQKYVVVIESWQMQCCGTPFKVGDKVEWTVHKYAKKMQIAHIEPDYYYEHHSSEWKNLFKLTGVVDEVKALYYSLELHPNPAENHDCTHHRVHKKTANVIEVNAWSKNSDGLEIGDYVIVLHDCVIRPIEETEVTFS